MTNPIVILLEETDTNFTFEVKVDEYTYTVMVSKAYWKKLTSEKIAPVELVWKSFAFLLQREGPGSILPRFELQIINHYFPEYEEIIQKSF